MASSGRRKGKVIRTPGSVLVSAAPPAAAHAPRYPSFLVAGSPPVPMGIANSPSQAIVAASSQQPFLTANAVDAKLLDGALSQAVQHAANTTSLSIGVLSSQGRWGRLIRLDEQANADCSSPYHVAWPECRTLRGVKLADVCGMMGSWTSRKLQAVLDICTLVPQLPNLPRPQGPASDEASLEQLLASAVHQGPSEDGERWVALPAQNGLWGPAVKEALGKVASWLHAFLCEPALQLGTASALLSAAGQEPAGGDSYNSTAPQLLPFSSVTVRLEWTSAGAVSPLKYEPTGRIILQVEGERHMLLVPPEHALGGRLAPFGFAHPYATYSAPGLASTACEAADEALAEHVCGLWPAFKQVRGSSCTLRPGDALFVPPYWSVHTEHLRSGSQVEAASVASSCRALVLVLQPPAESCALMAPSPAALRLQASWVVEQWVGAQVGVPHVRRLLTQLAASLLASKHVLAAPGKGAPAAAPPPLPPPLLPSWAHRLCSALPFLAVGPVGQYKLAVLAQDVLDLLASCCLDGDWDPRKLAQLLESMCDGRLLPTPWLDKYGFVDAGLPEHLRLTYQYNAPMLTAAQAAFPELFEATIAAKESEAAQVARREHLNKLALLTAPKAVEQLALPCSAPS